MTSGPDSVLNDIVAQVRAGLPERMAALPPSVLERRVVARPAPRDFVAALRHPALGLVAEVKKGSPGKGQFAPKLDHVATARAFRDAGAVAISVLTSPHFFAGDAELEQVADALHGDEESGGAHCPPLLRKEFHMDRYQVLEARALGADAFLLIVQILDRETMFDLIEYGAGLGMTAFVEVANPDDVDLVMEAGAGVVGINNRDLHTFREDLQVTEWLRPLVPLGVPVVAASGVRTPADLERMRAARVDAVLIGEALCTSADPAATIRELFGDG